MTKGQDSVCSDYWAALHCMVVRTTTTIGIIHLEEMLFDETESGTIGGP